MTVETILSAGDGPVPLAERALQLHPDDTIAIAKIDLAPGLTLAWPQSEEPSGTSCGIQLVKPIGFSSTVQTTLQD